MNTMRMVGIAAFMLSAQVALAGPPQQQPDRYSFELQTAITYDSSSGTVASSPDDTGTKLNESRIGARFGCGFLLGDTLEPMFELNYSKYSREVSDFVAEDSSIGYGLGVLFNMPTGLDRDKKKKKSEEGESEKEAMPKSELVRATWIPYLGFILAQETDTESRGATNVSTVSDGDLVTKLAVGTRWMLYEHLSVNFSLRASYQKSVSAAKDEEEVGGSVSKLELEARMLELSLFL